MFIVHAIQSEKDGRIYVGFTGNLDRRVHEHTSVKQALPKGIYQDTKNKR